MITVNFSAEVDEERTRELFKEIKADPMSGWMDLPERMVGELPAILEMAKEVREKAEVLVCIGIGGSYLGHRAVIEALRPESGLEIVYAGNSLSRRELERALKQVGERDFVVNVISKSGTTLEPAVAFEAFKKKLVEKYGLDEAYQRIYATTDVESGALHDEAVKNGYKRLVVPSDTGGRYSVLSAVGLFPMAVMGVDVKALLCGTREDNLRVAVEYAWMRHALGVRGYDTEVFASFEPATAYFNEWLKQLFGESEGKNRQGVWPASVIYSTDLHSLGQFMQDGRRNLWETIIDFPTDEMNQKVVAAVKKAHPAGGIPVLSIGVPSYDEKGFGELIYFFEVACALSAKLFGVNPFNQPGVEAYKMELRNNSAGFVF